ncbi:hypothetical protein SRABI106_02434 [Rahnella aquatilis]|nr:hypothetical protein SRABI106_02434 [Rahnella aquatilis]
MIGQRTVQQSPFFILIRLAGITRLPQRDKTLFGRCDDMRFYFKEIFRHEVFDIFIATDHQSENRGLYASDGEHAVVTGVAPQNGVGAGHIDAVKPVGTGAGQRGNTQRNKITVVAQPLNSTLDGLRVEIVNQAALGRVTFFRRQFEIIQHFIHQQLPFAIRVTGVDNLRGLEQ